MADPVTGAVDAHHHVWDLAVRSQDWLDEPGLKPLRRTFTTDDYREAAAGGIAGRPVTTTVVVQCLPSVPETEELLNLADDDPLVGAVVGWVDLTEPGLDEEIARLQSGHGGRWLRGVRHLVQGEIDTCWLARPDVMRGLRCVQRHELCYDLLVRPHQLPAAVEVARALTGLPLVLDHAGKPDIAAGELEPWARDVRALARHPHVSCKVSGLVTEADWARWTPGDLAPVVDILFDAFGPERLMFGSDWPVCLLASSWAQWADTAAGLLGALDPAEQDLVLFGTAARVYGLEAP